MRIFIFILLLVPMLSSCDISKEARARKAYLWCLRYDKNKNCDKERTFWQAMVKEEKW